MDVVTKEEVSVVESEGIQAKVPMLNEHEFSQKCWKRWKIADDESGRLWLEAQRDPAVPKGVDEMGWPTVGKLQVLNVLANRFNVSSTGLATSENWEPFKYVFCVLSCVLSNALSCDLPCVLSCVLS